MEVPSLTVGVIHMVVDDVNHFTGDSIIGLSLSRTNHERMWMIKGAWKDLKSTFTLFEMLTGSNTTLQLTSSWIIGHLLSFNEDNMCHICSSLPMDVLSAVTNRALSFDAIQNLFQVLQCFYSDCYQFSIMDGDAITISKNSFVELDAENIWPLLLWAEIFSCRTLFEECIIQLEHCIRVSLSKDKEGPVLGIFTDASKLRRFQRTLVKKCKYFTDRDAATSVSKIQIDHAISKVCTTENDTYSRKFEHSTLTSVDSFSTPPTKRYQNQGNDSLSHSWELEQSERLFSRGLSSESVSKIFPNHSFGTSSGRVSIDAASDRVESTNRTLERRNVETQTPSSSIDIETKLETKIAIASELLKRSISTQTPTRPNKHQFDPSLIDDTRSPWKMIDESSMSTDLESPLVQTPSTHETDKSLNCRLLNGENKKAYCSGQNEYSQSLGQRQRLSYSSSMKTNRLNDVASKDLHKSKHSNRSVHASIDTAEERSMISPSNDGAVDMSARVSEKERSTNASIKTIVSDARSKQTSSDRPTTSFHSSPISNASSTRRYVDSSVESGTRKNDVSEEARRRAQQRIKEARKQQSLKKQQEELEQQRRRQSKWLERDERIAAFLKRQATPSVKSQSECRSSTDFDDVIDHYGQSPPDPSHSRDNNLEALPREYASVESPTRPSGDRDIKKPSSTRNQHSRARSSSETPPSKRGSAAAAIEQAEEVENMITDALTSYLDDRPPTRRLFQSPADVEKPVSIDPSFLEMISITVVRAWGLSEALGPTNPYIIVDWESFGRSTTHAVSSSTAPRFGSYLRFRSPLSVSSSKGSNDMIIGGRGYKWTDTPILVLVYSRNQSVSDEFLGQAIIKKTEIVQSFRTNQSIETHVASMTVALQDNEFRPAGFVELLISLES